MTLQKLKELDEFIDHMDKASPKVKKLAKKFVSNLLEKGMSPEEAMGITPEVEDAIYNLAYRYFQGGKYKESLGLFYLILKVNPKSERAAFGLAASYHHLGDYANAVAHYLICETLDYHNPIPHFHLYDCYVKLNYPELAEEALENTVILAKDPIFAPLRQRALMEYESIQREKRKKKENK